VDDGEDDDVIAELGDDAAYPRQLGEHVGFIDEFPGNLLRVVSRVAGDVVVDGFEIDFGLIRPISPRLDLALQILGGVSFGPGCCQPMTAKGIFGHARRQV
jgi:hypothetical protein